MSERLDLGGNIKVYVEDSYEDMSVKAANLYNEVLTENPEAVLGLATGTTPLGLYSELIDRNKKGEIDFSKVKTVNLDEYAGLPGTHNQSYRYFMNENLFNHINIDKENTHVPNGMAEDFDVECTRYEALIDSLGGVGLQLLGIGNNGHLGFNEPSDKFTVKTNYVELTPSTIEANSRLFNSKKEVPTHALTMGFGQIMLARKVLLLANGEKKSEILSKALLGEVTPEVPASILRFHPDVTVIIDKEAGKDLLKK